MNTGDLQTEEGGGDIPVTRLFQIVHMAFSFSFWDNSRTGCFQILLLRNSDLNSPHLTNIFLGHISCLGEWRWNDAQPDWLQCDVCTRCQASQTAWHVFAWNQTITFPNLTSLFHLMQSYLPMYFWMVFGCSLKYWVTALQRVPTSCLFNHRQQLPLKMKSVIMYIIYGPIHSSPHFVWP